MNNIKPYYNQHIISILTFSNYIFTRQFQRQPISTLEPCFVIESYSIKQSFLLKKGGSFFILQDSEKVMYNYQKRKIFLIITKLPSHLKKEFFYQKRGNFFLYYQVVEKGGLIIRKGNCLKYPPLNFFLKKKLQVGVVGWPTLSLTADRQSLVLGRQPLATKIQPRSSRPRPRRPDHNHPLPRGGQDLLAIDGEVLKFKKNHR